MYFLSRRNLAARYEARRHTSISSPPHEHHHNHLLRLELYSHWNFEMATFTTPEDAWKRAEELINVGQKQEALEVLHSFITSRWFIAWTKTHERLLLKYVDLCLDMKRGRHAKDGLIQYHDSLEEARDIDDLEADRRLEDLSIGKSKVNGIDAQILN
ncbi:hypothetical protein CDL12_21205 [Handroanthus impetiginosus]|uniref:eIF3a PCI domain-containing protein n=1 Tax=Handroanthus impetiginosus TaxID=429701 RepID=A0A2G9GLR1_9LAMI|nr:hypothetical protein CDL12_21205 [Handroanthus impetiginosus]